MELHEYIRKCPPLRLADLEDLRSGDTLDVVAWPRNFEAHWINPSSVPGRHYDAKTFFAVNRCRLTWIHPHQWVISFSGGDVAIHPIHLDVWTTWCAVNPVDGRVDVGPKRMHVSEFARDTRVGWRGPMALWENVGGTVVMARR